MIIRLESRTEYNLSNNEEFKKLSANISTMKSREQWPRLETLYSKMNQYQTYSGTDNGLNNAKTIAIKLDKILSAHLEALMPLPPTETALTEVRIPIPIFCTEFPEQGEDYLYLPLIEDSLYYISMAPLNSSGDIYHILAYLILAKAQGKRLPKVQLNYDIAQSALLPIHSQLTVGDQVKRSLDFARIFGFADQFFYVELNYNTGRENVRRSEPLSESLNLINYLDKRR